MSIRTDRRHLSIIRSHQTKNVIREKLMFLLCFTMIFSCCFFTHNIIVKITSLGLLVVFGIKAHLSRINDIGRISYLIGLAFPIILLLISTLNSGDLSSAMRGSYCAVFFLALPIIIFYGIPLEKTFEYVMRIVIVLVLGSLLLDLTGRVDIFTNPLLLFMYENNELAVATKGAQYLTYWKVFLQADALLIIYGCFCYEKRKRLWLVLCGLTAWFSGSMANPIAFIVCIVAMWIENTGKVRLSQVFIIFGLFTVIAYSIIPFMLTSQDMVIRASALNAYGDILRDPGILLFGQGYGSEIYVSARNEFSITTEWSFFEMIRWYGLIGFTLFIAVIVYPFRKLEKTNRRWMVYAMIGYLTIAYTNPLLYTTTGMVAYIMLYYEFFLAKQEASTYQEEQKTGDKAYVL